MAVEDILLTEEDIYFIVEKLLSSKIFCVSKSDVDEIDLIVKKLSCFMSDADRKGLGIV